MEAPPAIILYTSDENVDESNKLRSLLVQTGFSYKENHVDQERHTALIVKYGGQVQVPGIQVDNIWIAEHEENIAEFIGNYWLDKLLATTADSGADSPRPSRNRTSTRRASVPAVRARHNTTTADIQFDPLLSHNYSLRTRESSLNVRCQSILASGLTSENAVVRDHEAINPTVSDYDDFAPLTASKTEIPETSRGVYEHSTVLDSYLRSPVRLPNGSDVPVGNLLRLLLSVTKHECDPSRNHMCCYFRGCEGFKVWKSLFFDKDSDEGVGDNVIMFGRMLLERGLMHNYTPEVDNLHHASLVLQPLFNPRLLNSFVMLPWDKEFIADSMPLILKLSRGMDALCAHRELNKPGEFVERFQRFEERVCELQIVCFPTKSVDKVTFALNLFNLMVRHAMILSDVSLLQKGGYTRHWRFSWPESLIQMEDFMHTVCYYVGGKSITLASLRDSLYGHAAGTLKIRIGKQKKVGWWRNLFCRQQAMNVSEKEVYYESPVLQNVDPRIVFAMTWGTQSSPFVSTIYPERLSEGLRTHAELYCQHHVQVDADRVSLPLLLSWYREDFGRDPDQVLLGILGFLSPDQKSRLGELRDVGKFKIAFSSEYNWEPGLHHVTPQLRNACMQRQQPPQGRHETKPNDVGTLESESYSPPTPTLLNDGGGKSKAASAKSATSSTSKRLFDSHLVGQLSSPRRSNIRSTSRGDMKPRPRGSSPTETMGDSHVNYANDLYGPYDDEDDDDGDDDYDDDYDDSHSVFHTIVSEITYGSEFEDLLLGARSRRRLCI